MPRPKKYHRQVESRTSLYLQQLTSRLPLSGKDSHTLAFLINWPRASHSTLVVALFPRVVLHVPINKNDLTMHI
jgi:hypothetical protein